MPVEAKTERFEMRLTSDEKERLAAKAAQFELSISEYVRCVTGLSELPDQVTDVAEETYFRLGEVYGELNRVGASLNQIAQAIDQQTLEQLSQQITQSLNVLRLAVDDLRATIHDLRSQIDGKSNFKN